MRTIDLIQHPELLNKDTIAMLQKMQLRYPYFQTTRLLLLQNLYKIHSPQFTDELRKSAILLADRRALFNLIESKNYEIEIENSTTKSSEESASDRTFSLIQDYLSDKPQEISSRRISLSEAAQDYATFLMQIENEEQKAHQETPAVEEASAHRATAKHKLPEIPDEELNVPTEESLPKEAFYTENMAQIYIKQHKYDAALEIIKAIYADNPKKSSYFADQIRFLEKIISLNKQKIQ